MGNKHSIYAAYLLCFFASQFAFSQDLLFARKIADTLSSEAMHGRGYVNRGDEIAAEFIRSQFLKSGAKSYDNHNFYQPFSFPVNTFPGAIKISTDSKSLQPGKDFIVSPGCPSINGTYELVWIKAGELKKKKKEIKKNISSKILAFNIEKKEETDVINEFLASLQDKPAAVFRTTEKLTWSVSRWVDDYPEIEITKNALAATDNKVTIEVQNKFVGGYYTQNVIGWLPGSEKPDSFIVFCAHYDHLGQMGASTYFPGANDNASGIALLLDLVRHYSTPENKPKYSILFIAFAAEEAGLVGSKYYNDHPLFPLTQIKFLINLDLMGNGDEGITVVNATEFKPEFEKLKELNNQKNYLTEIKSRGKAANSDHYFFTENNVRCFFIYTLGGSKAYHDIYDDAQTLPFSAYENVFKLLTDFTSYLENKQ